MSRYLVGIDLGTSNSAVAYADAAECAERGRPILRELEIPQLIGPGDIQARKLLPSALYVPAEFELKDEELALPWSPNRRGLVGEAARRLGAKTPVRLIESAKSWLCHGGVNRTASILPWHAPDEIPKMSPVEASAAYLSHIRVAWDRHFAGAEPAAELALQSVVVTVPASFDEIARRLTLDAAKNAGLADVTLIEEPLAAFYGFVARTGGTSLATGLADGERVLVADVGGGTTDFTLIDVRIAETEGNDSPTRAPLLGFERTAVGDHLLLGGDNMDLALAHAMEAVLSAKKRLDPEAFTQLKLECRLAKETLFSHPDRASIPIVITGRGSKVIAGSLRADLTRDRLMEIVVDGYFPPLPTGDAARPSRGGRSGLAEYGLPYAADPAITRHLAAFMLRHARDGEPFARVDAILFNGGALKPIVIRDRLSRTLGDWMRGSGRPEAPDPRPLVYDEGEEVLELSVARGAAYYGLVRRGLGIRVGGGSPREYFLGLGLEEGELALPAGMRRVLCVAPRGMQEGQRIEVSNRDFTLVTNRPVQFPIFSTSAPRSDPAGTVLTLSEDELTTLPPLKTVVKFGKQKAGTAIPVRIQARRTELDSLELSCVSKMSGARFKLEFDLRADALATSRPTPSEEAAKASPLARERATSVAPFGGAGARTPPEFGEIPEERVNLAKARIDATFATTPPRLDSDLLGKGLEQDLGMGRDSFPLNTLRLLAEHLLERMDRRGLSAALEARWLNLVGFCLRPGFGVPLDEWRVRQLWKIHAQGVLHPGDDPCELNWWILWRRVAGGLPRGHQEELSSIVFPLIAPALAKRAKRKPPRQKSQEAAEMWRAAASLENLSAKSRALLGDTVVDLILEGKAPKAAIWCLGRIGARKLLYGPHEATVRPATAAVWAKRIMTMERPIKDEDITGCLISLGRLVEDRQFDLEEEQRKEIAAYLEARGVEAPSLAPLTSTVDLDQATQRAAFGEGLPAGLRLL